MKRKAIAARPPRRIYAFRPGRVEGSAKLRDLLGGKGAALSDMTRAGLPVPPGFSITTETCAAYHTTGKLPDGLLDEVRVAIVALEKATKKRFGDPANPLLVSVRSGAAISMPGMMETILNVGLNDTTVAALAERGEGRFAFDSYRRLIAMYAAAVDGVDGMYFEDVLFDARRAAGVSDDRQLSTGQMQTVAIETQAVYQRETGRAFPQEPFDQLAGAIEAVFRSWAGRKAIRYREINKIEGLAGTAVTVQSMVFGNAGEDSATGVAFTRDPSTGRKVFYGEFLVNAQGEDLVAGVRTPLNCRELFPKWNRNLWRELQSLGQTLEQRYRDVQDFEFTVEHGAIYLLQTRSAQRTAAAAVRIAVDLVKEPFFSHFLPLSRVDATMLDRLRPPVFDPKQLPKPIAKGLPASPGAAVGKIAFTADEAEARTAAGERVILVRPETYPEDIAGFHAAAGVLTSTGGMTSHAAVVARGMDRVCVVGAGKLQIDAGAKTLSIKIGRKVHTFGPDDILSIDGTAGEVYAGEVPTIIPKPAGPLKTFLIWMAKHERAAHV